MIELGGLRTAGALSRPIVGIERLVVVTSAVGVDLSGHRGRRPPQLRCNRRQGHPSAEPDGYLLALMTLESVGSW